MGGYISSTPVPSTPNPNVLVSRIPVHQTYKKLCLFVSCQPNKVLPSYTRLFLSSIQQAEYDLLFVTTNMFLDTSVNPAQRRFREPNKNIGLPELAYKYVFQHDFVKRNDYDWFLLCTDNKIGPLHGQKSFVSLLDRMHKTECDFWQLIEEDETFIEFSRNVFTTSGFHTVLQHAKFGNFRDALHSCGFQGSVAYPTRPFYRGHPYHNHWPSLVLRRFPFLPLETLEFEDTWWKILGSETSFDRSLVTRLHKENHGKRLPPITSTVHSNTTVSSYTSSS